MERPTRGDSQCAPGGRRREVCVLGWGGGRVRARADDGPQDDRDRDLARVTSNGRPLEDTIAEAERIAVAASAQNVRVKLLGGAGIHLHSPSAHHAPLRRKYGDLDYVISTRDRKAALAFFPSLGYEANERFNLMQGDRRLYFFDATNGKQVDVFIDVIRMSHVIDLRGRLAHNVPCASPSDR